jgi:hypothetical protein
MEVGEVHVRFYSRGQGRAGAWHCIMAPRSDRAASYA